MLTEQQNPNTHNIDQMTTLAMITSIHNENRAVEQAVERALPDIARAVDAISERLARGGRLFYVGAGTSGRLGVLDASECPPTYNTSPEQVQGIMAGGVKALYSSVEDVEDDAATGSAELQTRQLSADDVVVGIAASGRTPFVLGALAFARTIGAVTIGIANNAPSTLLENSDIPIAIVTGPEVVAGSTRMKAGTAQKLVLNMLSTAAMIKLGKVYDNLMVDVQVKNQKLRQRAELMVAQLGGVEVAQAARLLREAGDETKVAIVMARRGIPADEARSLLAAAGGYLRQVIE
ncbi:MAG: N-acetylmuramic acid 6-phosphate etherase [Anaerolineae bacterium]|nr:N-acetylmuramic acid 6-phosphate etherase [Anaerolineae bacterium]